MSWRIEIEHRSHYRYVAPVHASYNEARLTPMTTDTQLVLNSVIDVTPPTRPSRYLDYWGSVVHVFDLQQPHTDLTVTGRSLVETTLPVSRPGLSWPEMSDPALADDFAEVLAPTPAVPADPRLAAVAAELRAGRTPDETAQAAIEWVRGQLSYVAGSTSVHTSAVEAWEGGAGVCQDFAHLALAVLRAAGIPGRYCSGYFHPFADAGIGQTIQAESHAWMEYWTGEWHGLDPTIGWPVGERHVLVARARDYGDVSPLKGVIQGGPTERLDVAVSLTRVG